MSDYDITIVTCPELPKPDLDEAPLVGALERAGLTVRVRAWSDQDVDWSKSTLTLIRSTWDYYHHRDDYLAWAEHVSQVSRLFNPLEVVRWNSHKGYLVELSERGVSTVPTVLVEQGSKQSLSEICDERGWTRVVVKPAVSAGSFRTHVIEQTGDEPDEPDAPFSRLVAERDTLVQPYVDAVDTYGERSIIVIDDKITHSVKKHPRFAGQQENVTGPHPINQSERELAEKVLAEVDHSLLYARVDMVPNTAGVPMLTELELIEPSLFFRFGEEALTRLTAALASAAGRAPQS